MTLHVQFYPGDGLAVEIDHLDAVDRARLYLSSADDRGRVLIDIGPGGLRLLAEQCIAYLAAQEQDRELHALFGVVGPDVQAAFDRVERDLETAHERALLVVPPR